MDKQFVLTLDVDMLTLRAAEEQEKVIADIPGLKIELLDQETGHGFGLAEVIPIAVTIGSSITADVAADYVRNGIKAVIRRVRGTKGETDGTKESLRELIESEREDPEASEK